MAKTDVHQKHKLHLHNAQIIAKSVKDGKISTKELDNLLADPDLLKRRGTTVEALTAALPKRGK